MSLEVSAMTRLGAFTLNADFTSDSGSTAILGRSGAGKTTLINIIAGLIRPIHGRVRLDGALLLDTDRGVDLAAHKRRIGYVFQESRLFPHLSVRQNLLYGRWFVPRRLRQTSVETVVDLLDLGPLLHRGTAQLSGGEKQRVAIGRALLASPRLLLMDEPLSSLDEARKQEVMPFLERLRDQARVPIIYVSHSVAEIKRLSKTVVLISEGQVIASGPTADVISRIRDAEPTFSISSG
jgi:molybdate transport system ATP-binding protein